MEPEVLMETHEIEEVFRQIEILTKSGATINQICEAIRTEFA